MHVITAISTSLCWLWDDIFSIIAFFYTKVNVAQNYERNRNRHILDFRIPLMIFALLHEMNDIILVFYSRNKPNDLKICHITRVYKKEIVLFIGSMAMA